MRMITINCGAGYRYEVPVHLIAEIFHGGGGWGITSERRVRLTTGRTYTNVENLDEIRRAVAEAPEPGAQP